MTKFKFAYDKELGKELPCVEIDIPIYKCKVKILSKGNTAKLNKYWESASGAMCVDNYIKADNLILIRITQYSDASLVHELHHAVDMIMSEIGHKRNPEYDEPAAYLMAYLYTEAIKHKKKLSK